MKLTLFSKIKEKYQLYLYSVLEKSSLDEINDFMNKIHGGITKNCGYWIEDNKVFKHCENENCKVLCEALDILSTTSRPDFLTCVFNGNSQRAQKQRLNVKIAEQYQRQCCQHYSNIELNNVFQAHCWLINNSFYWNDIFEYEKLINHYFKQIDDQG